MERKHSTIVFFVQNRVTIADEAIEATLFLCLVYPFDGG